MGTDKALLPGSGEQPLVIRVCAALRELTPVVTIIGPEERYAHLGIPVAADLRPGEGPLGGIETALALGKAEWNLITACDMPGLTADHLRPLAGEISKVGSQVDCILCLGPEERPEPLCSLYRRTALAPVQAALDRGTRKITEALKNLQVVHFSIDNRIALENLNTPEDWSRYRQSERE